jgi:hypothetical protein
VAHFEILSAHPPIGVILSAAAFQAERRISRLTGLARKPNCTTTEIQNLRKHNIDASRRKHWTVKQQKNTGKKNSGGSAWLTRWAGCA